MAEVRRSHRVISNAIYNLIPQVWFLILTVFTTPFVLHRLGVDAYGILSIVTIVAGYLAFLDLGFNSAVIKFIAAHDAKGEGVEICRVIQTALCVFLLMALAAAALLFVFSGSLARILQTPESMQSEAVLALRLSAVSFGVNLVMGVFSAVPRALQRFDLVNALNLILGTLQILGTVLLLISGFHLQAVIVWGCALSGISLITYIAIAKRLVPMMSFRPRFDPEKFRELFKFSGFVMASNFTGVASAHSEKLILGGMAPIAQVTYYAVPFNLASRVLTLIPNNLFSVLFPAFAAMGVTDKQDTIREVYKRAFRFIFLAVAPISVLMGAFGSDLLRLWIDAEMSTHGGPVLAVLAVAILINAPAWVSVTAGQSLGRPALVAGSQAIHLLALIASGVILVPRYGALGAALAWLAGNVIGIPVLVFLVNRHVLALRTLTMIRESLLRPVCAAGLALAIALLLKPMVSGWFTLVLACAVVTGFYLAIAYRASLSAGDREMFRSFVLSRYEAVVRPRPGIAKSQI
jgi:O-antigen/teichoic acid export membrane protein